MTWEYQHRGYRVIFSDDESSADIYLADELVQTVQATYRVVWNGDEATQEADVTAMVAAIRWINQDIRAVRETAAPLPTTSEAT